MKEAQTTHLIHQLIRNRWSPRAFSEKMISPEDMKALMEAASWAPSSSNEQPWIYRYAFRNSEGFKMLWDCLSPGNQPWTLNASVLLVCVARKTFARNGKPNRHYMHDCGLANENLLLQATHMGFYGHAMAGFNIEDIARTLNLSDDEEPVCFIALGYLGDPKKLEEPNRSREQEERSRKSIEEISADISGGVD